MMFNDSPSTTRLLFLSAVIELWDRGFDTSQIAQTLKEKEQTVERALHEAKDLRRRELLNSPAQ